MRTGVRLVLCLTYLASSIAMAGGVTEFCLQGHFDLGVRYQGTRPEAGEAYPASWCVISEDDSHRVTFSGTGMSNADMQEVWTVAYLPPDIVRIVNRAAPPDIEFRGTDNPDEALRVRRLDPRRLVEEFRAMPEALDGALVEIREDRLLSVRTFAELPLRGRVNVDWHWDWTNARQPHLSLMLDETVLFTATGRWRDVPDDEAATLWQASSGAAVTEVPGDRWPAKIDMRLIQLTDGVYAVRGVRTGFQHLVVATDAGLVVADAPAGWVEFHHIPPSDLVPGLGVSGLSEKFVDFLHERFPGQAIAAVALTHFHDDHAGGARAFAAEGAKIYTTRESGPFLAGALNRPSMPDDRLTARTGVARILPVIDPVIIGSKPNRVKLVPLGPGPHAYAMLGIWALDKDYFFVSDVHVPRSDADAPREERATTECWFAGWAVNNLPADVMVANSHSAIITPVSRLAAYVDSDVCAKQVNGNRPVN